MTAVSCHSRDCKLPQLQLSPASPTLTLFSLEKAPTVCPQVIAAGWAAKVLEMQAEHERLLCDVRAGAAASVRRRLAAVVHRYEAQLAVVRGALAHTRRLVLTLRQALGD